MRREPNPNAGAFRLPDGYRDIGWLNAGDPPEYKACLAADHHKAPGIWTRFDNSLYRYRGTDEVTTCSACKIAWHTDSSD